MKETVMTSCLFIMVAFIMLIVFDEALDSPLLAEPHLLETVQHSKQRQTLANMTTIRNALNTYSTHFSRFPIKTSVFGGLSGIFPPFTTYYRGSDQDAWGTPYFYITDNQGYGYTLMSYGQDRISGGGKSPFDEDIVMISASITAPEKLTNSCKDFQLTAARMRAIGTALGSYNVDYNAFPIFTTAVAMGPDIIPRTYYAGPYTDAWGMPFKYVSAANSWWYEIKSFGKDTTEGDGSGEFDADIIYKNGELLNDMPLSCPRNPQSVFNDTQADMRAIGTALGSYNVDYNTFPVFSSLINMCDTSLFPNDFYYPVPCRDGWGTPFRYTGSAVSYVLTSYGKDCQQGYTNSEYDKDIIYSNGYFIAP